MSGGSEIFITMNGEFTFGDYGERAYKEDYKIAEKVHRKCFGFYVNDKEDLIAVCIACLWKYREKFDQTKAQYDTAAYSVCKKAIIRATRGKQRNFERGFLSLDMPLLNGENSPLASTLHDTTTRTEAEQSAELVRDDYHEINTEVLKRKEYQNTKAQEVLSLFFEGYTENEIATRVGCWRSYVQKVKSKYKEVFAEISRDFERYVVS